MPVSISGDGTLTGVSITTADLANSSVTVAKISATGTPSSTTFLAGDGSWQTTTPTTAQVLTATAGASVGAVGTYAMLGSVSGTGVAYTAGTTVAGSGLVYAGGVFVGSAVATGYSGTPSGTWRCMGYMRRFISCSDMSTATVFLRIS